MKIGKAILEEYSETYWKRPFDDNLDAVEKDDVWIVYNVLERQGTMQNGDEYVSFGGGVHVEISKKNGGILRINILE